MSRLSANLLLLVAGLVWGLGFVAQETAMEDIGPFTFMTLRFGLAALALFPMVLLERKKEKTTGIASVWKRKNLAAASLVGLMFFLSMASQQLGLLATTVTNAGVLTGLYVILTPLLALAIFGEKQPWMIWPAAALAFAGIWLLGGGGLDKLTWGDWLVVLCAVFAALHVLALGRAVTGLVQPATVACMQFAISCILSAIGFMFVRLLDWQMEPPVSLPTLQAAAPEIIYAALFAGALAFCLMAFCQQYTKAADAAILMSSEALFAAAAAALLIGERLSLIEYTGGVLLFSAILITSVAATLFEESKGRGEKRAD